MEKTNSKNRSTLQKFLHYSVYAVALATALPVLDTIYSSINKDFDKKQVRYVIDKSYGKLEEFKEGLIGNFSNKNSIDSFVK